MTHTYIIMRILGASTYDEAGRFTDEDALAAADAAKSEARRLSARGGVYEVAKEGPHGLTIVSTWERGEEVP